MKNPKAKSIHQQNVERFMKLAGQEVREKPSPTEVDLDTRVLRAKLILEEAIETVTKGIGVNIFFETFEKATGRLNGSITSVDDLYLSISNPVNLEELADGVADIKVVATGTLSAFGIADEAVQQAVDDANLDKFRGDAHRREDGKWIKPSDWQAPDICGILKAQGGQ